MFKFNTFITLLCVVVLAGLLFSLQGCSVNVIVAPHATLGVHSDLSQAATQLDVGYTDAAPLYDCVAGPADVCQ